MSDQSISRKADQFLNKEVLNILNASLESKLIKSNSKINENSFNEISTIINDQNKEYFEFSQSDMCINIEKENKEKDFNKSTQFYFNWKMFRFTNLYRLQSKYEEFYSKRTAL